MNSILLEFTFLVLLRDIGILEVHLEFLVLLHFKVA